MNWYIIKYPYSTTHYHCGCHIIEDAPNNVNLNKSIYCGDTRRDTEKCLYLPVLKMRRQRIARLT